MRDKNRVKLPLCPKCETRHPLNRCADCDKESLYCPCYYCLDKDNTLLVKDLVKLKSQIEKERKEWYDLLLDVLNQACGDGDGEIDNMCLSAYEQTCDYLKEKGLLEEVNSRIYNIVDFYGGKE